MNAARLRMALHFVVAFAFALQSYLVQAHFHPIAFAPTQFASVDSQDAAQKAPTSPGSKDNRAPAHPVDNCPICQSIAHAGHYTAPAQAVLPLPTDQPTSAYAFAVAHVEQGAVTHNWQSRAPPFA